MKGFNFWSRCNFQKELTPTSPFTFYSNIKPPATLQKSSRPSLFKGRVTFQRSGYFSWSWPNFKDKHLFYLDHDFEVLEHFSFRAPSFSHFHTWHKPNPSLSKSALKIKKTLAITKPKKDIYTHSHSYPLYSLSNYITKNIKISLIKGLQSN